MRLLSLDYFRAIAILLVVAGHSYGYWRIDSFPERVLANIITGGTTLFVFISGFFFHHVYYQQFNYPKFLANKIKQVLTPYLIFSLAGIAYYVFTSTRLPYFRKLGLGRLHDTPDYLEMITSYLWTGAITSSYWYIPFIMIMFVLSPIFIRYIKLSAISRHSIFIALLACAMLIHRPAGNLSPIHSLVYFMPIYLLGINCSLYRESVFELIKGKTFLLGLIVLLLSIIQVWFYGDYGNFHKKLMFTYKGIDIIIIQKIILCFFLLSLLQKVEHKKIPTLKLIASASFAIYFIHPWFLLFFTRAQSKEFLYFLPDAGVFIATFILATASSLLIAYVLKYLLKTKSRYITGW